MGIGRLVWKRPRKMAFFGLKYGQNLKNRAAHPHQDWFKVVEQQFAYIQEKGAMAVRKPVSK